MNKNQNDSKENISINASMRFKNINELFSKASKYDQNTSPNIPVTEKFREAATSISSLCEYADCALENSLVQSKKKEPEIKNIQNDDLKSMVMNLQKSQELLLKESSEMKQKLQEVTEISRPTPPSASLHTEEKKTGQIDTPIQPPNESSAFLSTNRIVKVFFM